MKGPWRNGRNQPPVGAPQLSSADFVGQGNPQKPRDILTDIQLILRDLSRRRPLALVILARQIKPELG